MPLRKRRDSTAPGRQDHVHHELKHKSIDVGFASLHICNHTPSFTQVLREVKRLEHSIHNCITSIVHDWQFIDDIHTTFFPRLPLLANLRCGLWYVPQPTATCYFKSTDGHHGQWSFSTSRLNLHVAEIAVQHGGICIVDATRRGKTFPVCLLLSF